MSPLTDEWFAFMPDPIREPFRTIAFEVMWLHARWNNYCQLFEGDPQQLSILDSTAPACFRIIHHCMKTDIYLSLARLTDPPSSSGRANLSLKTLMIILTEAGHPNTAIQCQEHMAALATACKPIRTRRNRRLAHSDLKTLLNLDDQPFPLIPPSIVNQALLHIREILNIIEGSFRDSETAYQAVALRGEAKALLVFLRKGLDASEQERSDLLGSLGTASPGSSGAA
jgi:hypothetical protein